MNNMILRQVGKKVTPLIQLLGIYVIIFGHLSPGGGFAGGTILGASFILYRMVNDSDKRILSFKRVIYGIAFALMIYGVLKGFVFVEGSLGLHNIAIPKGYIGSILSGGFILPLNILVGTVVALSFYGIYVLFERGEF